MKVPESLKEEHETFIDCLKGQSSGKGQTGAALRQLLKLVEPHIEKEDELVMPLLGSLRGLAAGDSLEDSNALVLAYAKYSKQYYTMYAEHSPIRKAIKKARAAAKKEGHQDIVETLDAQVHHSTVEEEVIYPAALLAGKVARGLLVTQEEEGSQTTIATTADRLQFSDWLSYFALDYAPISSASKTPTIRHHELDELLSEVEELADKGKLRVAISLLNATAPLILRSAVEEEARAMRIVMQNGKSRAEKSAAITRQHMEIADFMKHQLPELSLKRPDEARRSVTTFVRLVQGYLRQEKAPFSIVASEYPATEAVLPREMVLQEEVRLARGRRGREEQDSRIPRIRPVREERESRSR